MRRIGTSGAARFGSLTVAFLSGALVGCPAGNSSHTWSAADTTTSPDISLTDPAPWAPVDCPVSTTLTVKTLATCLQTDSGVPTGCTAYLPGATTTDLVSAAQNCAPLPIASTSGWVWSGACCPSGWRLACRFKFMGPLVLDFNYTDKTAAQMDGHKQKCLAVDGEVVMP